VTPWCPSGYLGYALSELEFHNKIARERLSMSKPVDINIIEEGRKTADLQDKFLCDSIGFQRPKERNIRCEIYL
jgi:hypothetical protein